MSAVGFLLQKQAPIDSLQSTCSKQLFGKVPGRPASLFRKDSSLDVFREIMEKFSKQLFQIAFFQNTNGWANRKSQTQKQPPPEVFCKKSCSYQFHKIHRPQACNFIKKEALAQVFSCEFCEISKNTFFTEHLWATAPIEKQIFGAKWY